MADQYSKHERLNALFEVLEKNGGWMSNEELASSLPWITPYQVTQYLNTLTTEGKVISRQKSGNFYEYSVNMTYFGSKFISQIWRK